MNVLLQNNCVQNKPVGSVSVYKCHRAAPRMTFGIINLLRRPRNEGANHRYQVKVGQRGEMIATLGHQRKNQKSAVLKHTLI